MPESSPSGSKRGEFSVLLVEDDEVLASVLREILSPLGEVMWTASGEAATEVLGVRAWDLIVYIELPGINGIEFLEIASQTDPDLASLVLSGHSSFEYAVAAIRASADDYMTKPVRPERCSPRRVS